MTDQIEKNEVREKLGLPSVESVPEPASMEKINTLEKVIDSKDKLTKADNTVKREIQIAKVEQYMLSGISSPHKIAKHLSMERRTVANYIEAVKARWSMSGSRRSLQQAKGAGLSRIDTIKRELWDVIEGRSKFVYTKGKKRGKVNDNYKPQSVDSDTKIKALKALLDCHDKELYLDGCSADMLQELPSSFDSGGNLSVAERKLDAQRMKDLVAKWALFLKESNDPPIDVNVE